MLCINLFRLLLSLSWPPLLWVKNSTWAGGSPHLPTSPFSFSFIFTFFLSAKESYQSCIIKSLALGLHILRKIYGERESLKIQFLDTKLRLVNNKIAIIKSPWKMELDIFPFNHKLLRYIECFWRKFDCIYSQLWQMGITKLYFAVFGSMKLDAIVGLKILFFGTWGLQFHSNMNECYEDKVRPKKNKNMHLSRTSSFIILYILWNILVNFV